MCPEIRVLIYEYVFTQAGGEILGLSREPKHDCKNGPPSSWIADSRRKGLVYGIDSDRETTTNASVLRTCWLIHTEAIPIFYAVNKILLYAEDNNDIYYWLLDIGEPNRRSIRHLAIDWAYGVQIDSGRKNVLGIIEDIDEMARTPEEETQRRRGQLIEVVQRMEKKSVDLITRTLLLLATDQALASLALYLPGVDAGDIRDVPNDNFYFAEEIFSNHTRNVHASIPQALKYMVGIKSLTLGYTKDIRLAEEVAQDVGVWELIVIVHPEGKSLGLNEHERLHWSNRGWRLEGAKAFKSLVRA